VKACKPLQTSPVMWEFEDQLPEMEDSDFDKIYPASRVVGVRLYPYVEDSAGNRIWLTNLPQSPDENPLP